MTPNRNTVLLWINKVVQYKEMHSSFSPTLKVATLVDSILEKRDLKNCIFADPDDAQEFTNVLTWRFGIPNLEYFIFSPNRAYIDKNNPQWNYWKNTTLDQSVVDLYRSRSNTEYPQPEGVPELPSSYNLFVMQDPVGIEYNHIVDAAAYATQSKSYTVFKRHPLALNKIVGLDSEYAIFIDASYNLNHLVEKADRVFSSWSSVSLNAMLADKPCATYDPMIFSELVPTIKSAAELKDIPPVSRNDLGKFLTWYSTKLCINVKEDGYEERIEKRILDHAAGSNVLV